MSKRAQLPNGDILEFPDNTPDAVMDKAVKSHLQGAAKPATKPKSWGENLWQSTKNAAAGAVEFAAAVPDAATDAMAGAMRYGAQGVDAVGGAGLRAIGADGAADSLHRGAQMADKAWSAPAKIGNIGTKIAPEPTDTAGKVARFGAGMIAGAGLASAASKAPAAIRTILGAPPTPPMPRNALSQVAKQTPKQARQAAGQAAARQDITMMPADVGGTGTRMASGIVRRTLGEIPMAEGARKAVASAANARDRVAGSIGRVTDEVGAGQAAQRGAKAFIRNSEARAEQLYETISVPATASAQTGNTRTALAELTKGLESNPRLSRIWTGNAKLKATLNALMPLETEASRAAAASKADDAVVAAQQGLQGAKADLDRVFSVAHAKGLRLPELSPSAVREARVAVSNAEGGLSKAMADKSSLLDAHAKPIEDGSVSWDDMKRLRSIVGKIVGQPGLSADGHTTAALRKFYGALSSDMEVTATAAGPRALTEFRRATQYFRGRSDRIDNVLSGVLGSDMQKGGEAAFQQINRWAAKGSGDSRSLARALRSMPADEAGTVRATVFSRMGQSSPGRQNADGLEFSPAEFGTQWNKMSNRAKSFLLPDAKHRADMNDIAVAMDGMKRAGQYANTSNTSLGVNAAAHASGMLAAPLLTAAIAGGEFSMGVLLSSPRVARALVRMPKTASPGAVRSTISHLGAIAKNEPAWVASEIGVLQRHLENTFLKAANQNTTASLAADPGSQQQQQDQPPPQP